MSNFTRRMSIKKSKWIHENLLPLAIILCLLGLLMLFVSNIKQGYQWVIGELGKAIFVAGLLSILYLLLIGEDPRIPERGIGLKKAYKNRNDLAYQIGGFFNLIKDAKREFIVVGTTLADFFDIDSRDELKEASINFLERVHKKQKSMVKEIKNPHFIIVVQNPSSSFLVQRGKEQNAIDGTNRIRRRMADGLEGIKWFLESMPHYLHQYIEVRFANAMPLCSMFIIDRDIVYIYFYRYGERQSTWFQFEQSDGSIIGEYIENYEELERLSDPVSLENIIKSEKELQSNRAEQL